MFAFFSLPANEAQSYMKISNKTHELVLALQGVDRLTIEVWWDIELSEQLNRINWFNLIN